MWLFTTSGFVSVVACDADNVMIRARDKKSLKHFTQKTKDVILHTPTADYPYRIIIARQRLATLLFEEGNAIDYPNFKSEVAVHRGGDFAHVLMKVWSAMHDVEDVDARKRPL